MALPPVIGLDMRQEKKLYLQQKAKEANVQALLFWLARKAGLEVYLEFNLPSSEHRRHLLTADFVLVCQDHVIACVEMKRGRNNRDQKEWNAKIKQRNGRQYRAYSSLTERHGIRLFYANEYTDMDELVDKLKKVQKRFLAHREANKKAKSKPFWHGVDRDAN